MLIESKDFKSILNFGFAGILIFAAHYLLLHFFRRYLYAPDLLLIHPFMLSITLVSVLFVKIIFKKVKVQVLGYVFMASSLVKMFLSIAFLIPLIQNDSLFRKEYVVQFFMIYFIYLVIEVYYLVQDFKIEKK